MSSKKAIKKDPVKVRYDSVSEEEEVESDEEEVIKPKVAKKNIARNDDVYEEDWISDDDGKKHAISSIKAKKLKRDDSSDEEESEEDDDSEDLPPKRTTIAQKNIIKKSGKDDESDDELIKYEDMTINDSNILNDNSEKIIQPTKIKTELMKHQKSIVRKMMDVEKNGEIILSKTGMEFLLDTFSTKAYRHRPYGKPINNNYFDDMTNVDELKIRTDFGILGDEVGAGKTLTIVTLLSINNDIKEHNYTSYGNEHFAITAKKKKDETLTNVDINFVIVPSKIIHQWTASFKDNSKLKVYSIETEKQINNILEIKYKYINVKVTYVKRNIEKDIYRRRGGNAPVEYEEKFYYYIEEKEQSDTGYNTVFDGHQYVRYGTRYGPKYEKLYSKLLKDIEFKKIDEQDNHYEKEIIVTEKRESEKSFNFNKMKGIDVILIKDTMYKKMTEYISKIKWKRIIFDEADSISYPSAYLALNSKFKWFMTGTPSGLTQSKPFLRKYFGDVFEYKYFTIKNLSSYVKKSIILPPPKRFIIKCLTPRAIGIIKNFISPGVMEMVNAGNTEEAIKALNCNVDTEDNIFKVITNQINDKLENYRLDYKTEKNKKYTNQAEKDTKLKRIEGYIKRTNEKLEEIKKRIRGLNDEYCLVCMDQVDENKTIVKCCNAMFCFECITVSLGSTRRSACPACNQGITQNDINVISNSIKKEKEKEKEIQKVKDKMDALKDIIMNKKDGSFMIFANYAETFTKIEKELKEMDVKYHILKGQGSVVAKHIDDFKEKRVNVLMLNAKFFGAGMNLQMTTDIIMFHRFTDEMEEQIVGRAQRLGRDSNSTLSVYYLVHDNEKQTFGNSFSFKDEEITIDKVVEKIKKSDKKAINALQESEKSDEECEEESSEEESDEESSEEESEEESSEEEESDESDESENDLKKKDNSKLIKELDEIDDIKIVSSKKN
jgi:hypothetical protein